MHDSKVELLPDLDSQPDTITIETDRFSTYAIIYKDATDTDREKINNVSGNDNGEEDTDTVAKDSSINKTKKSQKYSNRSVADGDLPETGDYTPIKLWATIAMISGFSYLLLYFTNYRSGMTNKKKREVVSRIIEWAVKGRRSRKFLSIAAIFLVLVYYHSIGKKTVSEWNSTF